MNKSKLKKKIESNKLDNFINKCHFIGFFCVQNIAVDNKIELKKNLNKQGFNYTLIKNTVLFKSLFHSIPKMKGIVTGSLAICYSDNDVSKGINFISLKEVFSILKKEKNIFFLGGFYKGSLVNRLFELKVSLLSNIQSINIENLLLIQSPSNNIVSSLAKSKNQLSLILSNKAE